MLKKSSTHEWPLVHHRGNLFIVFTSGAVLGKGRIGRISGRFANRPSWIPILGLIQVRFLTGFENPVIL
jgi:hypothetical protein